MLNIALVTLALAGTTTFNDVWNVVTDPDLTPVTEANEDEVRSYGLHQRPTYENSFWSVIHGTLARAVKETIADDSDILDRKVKLLHSNGICFAGTWEITEDTGYSGYMGGGKKGLVVARASNTFGSVLAEDPRGFSLAVKLFPTEDRDTPVTTANIHTIDILAGREDSQFLGPEVRLTNEPETGSPSLSWIPFALKVASIFSDEDDNPGFVPVTPLARAGGSSEPLTFPKWIMFRPSADTRQNGEYDFRDELDMRNHAYGLTYDIYVSETTADRSKEDAWKPIGVLNLTESKVSYACDRRLHFHHDRNF